MIGRTLGQYRVERLLGQGGMGSVYLAHDTELQRQVALKVVRHASMEDSGAGQLLREARTASMLQHPNICTVHAIGTEDGCAFIVMELITGETLRQRTKSAALPVSDVARFGAQIADALAHAHQRGIIHRDLKTANVMIDLDQRIKVVDFGIAQRAVAEEETQASVSTADGVAGTLPYMAPELLRGGFADELTDLWALGVVLYEAAAGRRPFLGSSSYELGSAIANAPIPALPQHVPASLATVVLELLERDRQARIGQAATVRVLLRRVTSEPVDQGVVVPEVTSPSRTDHAAPVATQAGIRSLAVLPLENVGGNPDELFFSEGMTEALITDLAKLSELRVTSRASAMRYRGSDKALGQIAAELNVDAVLEGSVMRAGDQVRISVNLVNALSDSHIWADSYIRDLKDVLKLQTQVASSIAGAISLKLRATGQTGSSFDVSVDPQAHEAFLRGRYFWNQRGPGVPKAMEQFRAALGIDPRYAPAHAGLADAFMLIGFYGHMEPGKAMPMAKAAALRALEIQPALAEIHSTLGFVHQVYDWDWSAAREAYERALTINASYSPARYWYATWFMACGDADRAIAEMYTALDYDPLSPFVHAQLGLVLLAAARHEEAVRPLQRSLELDPTFFFARSALGTATFFQGDLEEALGLLRQAVAESSRDPWALAALGNVFAHADMTAEADEVIAELVARDPEHKIHPLHVAGIQAVLGRIDESFRLIERGLEVRDPLVAFLSSDTQNQSFASIRNDVRFASILERLRIPEC